ncbi:hypothetical protein LCGC14_0389540 [marine sediment metagenome]|uniref:Uncharacterized protein n=1 Tax=marine sediment metagenome TaxID=412755 RepID=A0A0F9THZ3_9ZZZZ
MGTYEPDPFPTGDAADSEALLDYLYNEFQKLAASFLGVENILLEEMNEEPTKPRTGMIVLADGTNWNPGSGAGFYGYHSSSWNKLG